MISTLKQVKPVKKKTLPEPFNRIYTELQRGIQLAKCRKCGCMHGTLENMKASLSSLKNKEAKDLVKSVNGWLKKLKPPEYPCFGCKYCIPAEAMTLLTSKFPSTASSTLASCEFKISKNSWPPVAGEYSVLNKSAPVAVSTLASTKLEEKLARSRPAGLCIVGKTETENIGIDKIVKNVITNPAISFLVIAGKDTKGHQSGKTLLSLWGNGVDKNMRVIGSTGRRPILKNVSLSEVNTFRKQIQIDEQIGCENIQILTKRIKELSQKALSKSPSSSSQRISDSPDTTGSTPSCECHDCHVDTTRPKDKTSILCSPPRRTKDKIEKPQQLITAPKIKAGKPRSIRLDKAGYFVIIPLKKAKAIVVEHYSYDNKLLRTIEGKNSRDIYFTIINNKWITDLSHAAYIGKELARAELSIKKGFKFVQDGA